MTSGFSGLNAFFVALSSAWSARWPVAARATVSVVLALGIGALLGHPEWGAVASIGSFAGFYAPETPFRYRARIVAMIGCALVLAMLLGTTSAGVPVLAILVVGVTAGVSSFVCLAFEVPPPREYLIILAVLVATGLPAGSLTAALQRAGLVAVGAALGWLVTMSPALSRSPAPERRAVAAALSADSRLLEAIGSPDVATARHGAVAAVRNARVAVTRARLGSGEGVLQVAVAAEHLLEVALHLDAESAGPLDGGWAETVRGAAAAVLSRRSGFGDVSPEPGGAPELAMKTAIRQLREAVAGRLVVDPAELPMTALDWRELLGVLRWRSVILPASVRLGIAVAAAAGCGRALGLTHSYWVGLTAAAVLLGSNLRLTLKRSSQRVAGTSVGVVLAFFLLASHAPTVAVIAVAAACQFLAELAIPASYGVGVVFITVLALVVFFLGAPGENVTAAVDARLLDTAVGAVLAIVIRLILWPRATAARLPHFQAATLRSVVHALEATWASDLGALRRGDTDRSALVRSRRTLQSDLVVLRAVHGDAVADSRPTTRRTDERWPVTVLVERMAHLSLSVPEAWPPPAPVPIREFTEALNRLASAIAEPPAPDSAAIVAELTEYPRTSQVARELGQAVADLRRG